MARASKKDFIVETATRVFLENGFKGTSIDMVVAACQVSKPTVYNHFPDKAKLMAAVMERWLALNCPTEPGGNAATTVVDSVQALEKYLADHWWCAGNMSLYRLVIGEGWRFTEAAERFWQEFDAVWREIALSLNRRFCPAEETDQHFSAWLSHQLWTHLR